MKATFFSLFLTLVSLSLVFAQDPPASPHVNATGKDVTIRYGQPSKRGRLLFGTTESKSLEKYGKVWRIGADSATVITFKKDGTFGGKPVKKGKYTFFVFPGEKEWTIILNGQLGQWGAYDYDKHKSKDVLKVAVPAKKYSTVSEKLTFTVKDTSLDFQWDKEGFSVPFKF